MVFAHRLAAAVLAAGAVSVSAQFNQLNLSTSLSGGPANPPCGQPWGCRTVEDTNPYTDFPQTNVTRFYDFTISRGWLAPDGYNRSVILINNQFPGPLIEANWGDTINVTVHNQIDTLGDLDAEGTSLHWHGQNQKVTPWYDGIPGVSQCPITPETAFTYSFVASNYGSSFYHSHYSSQYAAGILGPMVVHGPVQTSVDYDYDLGPVLLGDWYHAEYFAIVQQVLTNDTSLLSRIPVSNNNLIQGLAAFLCPNSADQASTVDASGTPTGCTPNPDLAKFQVEAGKKYRLRLVNAGAEGVQRFSIDGHNLTIFANDYVPIQPYETNIVTLGVGQRSDVILEANADGGAFWVRSNITLAGVLQPQAKAALYYAGTDSSTTPDSAATPFNAATAYPGNDALTLTTPVYALPVSDPDLIINITIGYGNNGTNYTLFYINDSALHVDYNEPILLENTLNKTDFSANPEWNVYNTAQAKSVRMYIDANFSAEHPMHLHGHDFYVLAEGNGTWDGTITNPSNPQRRDTHILPKVGRTDVPGEPNNRPYMVIQWDQDNPGVWPFHCHIAWHTSNGLGLLIEERPEDVAADDYQIPGVMTETCRDWWTWSGVNPVDEIDSGI